MLTKNTSNISEERKNQIDQLAKLAFVNDGGVMPKESGDYIPALQYECYSMQRVLEEVGELGSSYINFFSDINEAFTLLVKDKPSAFRTYVNLTDMFRVFAQHNEVVNNKRREIVNILNDIDAIEGQEMKGGSNV